MNIVKISILAITLILSLVTTYLGSAQVLQAKTIDQIELKTLQIEIDRLSVKYDIASSTVNRIIQCESKMYGGAENHNLDKNGKTWSIDKGWLQINSYFHTLPMSKLGLDINDKWDSLEYGFMLMDKQGFQPWSASKKCWLI